MIAVRERYSQLGRSRQRIIVALHQVATALPQRPKWLKRRLSQSRLWLGGGILRTR